MSLTMAATHQQPSVDEATQVYEKFGKPREATHKGQFLAVSKTGQTVIAPTLVAALKEATERFGPGNYIFKIGERVVGKWRWLTAG